MNDGRYTETDVDSCHFLLRVLNKFELIDILDYYRAGQLREARMLWISKYGETRKFSYAAKFFSKR